MTHPSEVASLNQAFAAGGPKGFWRKRHSQWTGANQATSSYLLAAMAARAGDKEEAFAQLEQALTRREMQHHFRMDPAFAELRTDACFTNALQRMNLRP